ncbi:MAG: GIN domain-containing protein [Aurantibacter sp.]
MVNLVRILLVVILLSMASCSTDDGINVVVNGNSSLCSDGTIKIVGEGSVITETLAIADFNSIVNLQGINVNISQGQTQVVTATGQSNIINKIVPIVSDNTWTVVLEEGCYSNVELTIDITIPTLDQVTSRSSGGININGFEGVQDLTIESMGSGHIIGNSNFESLINLEVVNRGSGNIVLYPLEANDCTIISAGSGNNFVYARNTLNVTLSGSGNVSYKGSPTITQTISGSGTLIDDN